MAEIRSFPQTLAPLVATTRSNVCLGSEADLELRRTLVWGAEIPVPFDIPADLFPALEDDPKGKCTDQGAIARCAADLRGSKRDVPDMQSRISEIAHTFVRCRITEASGRRLTARRDQPGHEDVDVNLDFRLGQRPQLLSGMTGHEKV
jgi:hypothetical protein